MSKNQPQKPSQQPARPAPQTTPQPAKTVTPAPQPAKSSPGAPLEGGRDIVKGSDIHFSRNREIVFGNERMATNESTKPATPLKASDTVPPPPAKE